MSPTEKPMDRIATSQPRKGRYFPLTPVDVVALASRIQVPDASNGRLIVCLNNPTPAQDREGLIAELTAGGRLALYSMLEDVEPEAGARRWRSVLDTCPSLLAHKTPARSGRGPVYAFLANADDELPRVVVRWYHYQTRKYRSTDKFSGGPNRKLIRIDEHPLDRFGSDRRD
jgi:hypothetical protein